MTDEKLLDYLQELLRPRGRNTASVKLKSERAPDGYDRYRIGSGPWRLNLRTAIESGVKNR